MTRVACALLLLVVVSAPVCAADLPPGAIARLGDDRFRTGDDVLQLALSPDGKQFATAHGTGWGLLALAVWDSDTGRIVHEHAVNRELFKGLVWGKGGAYAVVRRAELGPKGNPEKEFPDDFCVWNFTDPKTGPPLVPPRKIKIVERTHGRIDGSGDAVPAKSSPEYTGFQFSADGTRVAARWKSADEKHAVHVFELKPADTVAKLKRVATIDLGAEGAGAVRISADGKTLVTFRGMANADDMTATVWDVATGKPQAPMLVSGNARRPTLIDGKTIIQRLMLTPDAHSLALHTAEENEWGFDVVPLTLPYKSAPKKPARIRLPYGPTNELLVKAGARDDGGYAFFPSGNALVVATDRFTLVIDTASGKELGRLEGHAYAPDAVAVSADGTRIATADLFGLIRLWDAKTFRPLHDAPGHRAPVEYAELSPDGKRLLTWTDDETVRLWDVATGTELRAFTGAPGLRKVRSRSDQPTFTPDGTTILFSTKDRLVARDLQTGLEVPLPGDLAKSKPRYAVFAPNGTAVLTWADDDPPLAVYDWPSGKKRFELDVDGPVQPANFSPDSAAVFTEARVRRWDAKTGKELAPAWVNNRLSDISPLLSLRPNPLHLIYAPDGKPPQVIEAGTGNHLAQFRLTNMRDDARSFAEANVALSPGGEQFAVSSGRETDAVLVCEAVTGQTRRELRGHRGEIRVLGFTPDGTKLLTAGGDHTVLVWDMRLQSVPLPDALKKETNAAKLWNTLATGSAGTAYLAMARLSREPDAALKLVKMKLKPATAGATETDAANLTDCRAIELLEALGTDESRALLKELAAGHATAFRTQEAKRALERHK